MTQSSASVKKAVSWPCALSIAKLLPTLKAQPVWWMAITTLCRFAQAFFIEKRFQKDPPLMEKYCKTLNDYISKGHARKVPDDQIDPGDKPLWYLPHHPVIHEHKPGKVLVVF